MSNKSKVGLLQLQGAKPFYLAIFLNACIDLGHKITIQNTVFKLYEGDDRIVLTAVINAFVLLPYILFFALSGGVNARNYKADVMRFSAVVMFVTTLLIIVFYALGWFWWAFFTVLLMGVQSAFFGPAKLAYIRLIASTEQLPAANGLAQALVIIAILLSSLGFSIAFEWFFSEPGEAGKGAVLQQMLVLSLILLLLAVIELIAAFKIPRRNLEDVIVYQDQTKSKIGYGVGSLKRILCDPVLLCVAIGLTLFWSSGQVMLAVFPEYFASTTGETNTAVIQGVMACMAMGVGAGSIVAGRLGRERLGFGLIFPALVGMVVCLAWVQFVDTVLEASVCFLFAGLAGGLLIVPLYSMLQLYVEKVQLGPVLAANNFLQNLVMALFLVATALAALASFPASFILFGLFLYGLLCASVTAVGLARQRLALDKLEAGGPS